MKFNSVKRFVNFTALIFLVAGSVMAQSVTEGLKPRNCEYNISILTAVSNEAGADGLIIMISRLGDNETRNELNLRRLHNAKTFLEQSGNRQSNTIVTAQGESVKGFGRIELYVNGKLLDTLAVNKNSDLSVGACVFDEGNSCDYKKEKNLYPCLDSIPLKKQNLRKNGKPNE